MTRKEDLEFLSDLQQELKTQEIDSQAAPRFWVIRQWEKQITDADFSEGVILVDTNSDSYEEFSDDSELDKLIKYLDENYPSELQKIYDHYEIENTADLIDTIVNYECLTGFVIYHYKKVGVIKENTMFLTKQAAKVHIEFNSYHYNDTAHTYAMTAWRSPKVERLLEILENFDFEGLL